MRKLIKNITVLDKKGVLEKLKKSYPNFLKKNIILNYSHRKDTILVSKKSLQELCLAHIDEIKETSYFYNNNLKALYTLLIIKALLNKNNKVVKKEILENIGKSILNYYKEEAGKESVIKTLRKELPNH